MADFDPDSYLKTFAQKPAAPAFDPDEYLKSFSSPAASVAPAPLASSAVGTSPMVKGLGDVATPIADPTGASIGAVGTSDQVREAPATVLNKLAQTGLQQAGGEAYASAEATRRADSRGKVMTERDQSRRESAAKITDAIKRAEARGGYSGTDPNDAGTTAATEKVQKDIQRENLKNQIAHPDEAANAEQTAKGLFEEATARGETKAPGALTTTLQGLTGGAALMGEASLGLPAMAGAGALQAYGEAKNAGKSENEAEDAGTRSLIALAAFGAQNKLISSGIAKYLGNVSALKTFLVQALGQGAGNEVTSRLTAAYEAAMDAPEGQRIKAATEAAKKNDLGTIATNLGFTLMGAHHAVGEASSRVSEIKQGVGPVVGQNEFQSIPDGPEFEDAIKQYQKLPDNDPRKHAFEGEIARRAALVQSATDAGTPTEPPPAVEAALPPSEVPQAPESQEVPQPQATGTSNLFKQAQADALKQKAQQAAAENPDVSATANAVSEAADAIKKKPFDYAKAMSRWVDLNQTEGGETPNEKETNEGQRQQEGRVQGVLTSEPTPVIPETVQPPSDEEQFQKIDELKKKSSALTRDAIAESLGVDEDEAYRLINAYVDRPEKSFGQRMVENVEGLVKERREEITRSPEKERELDEAISKLKSTDPNDKGAWNEAYEKAQDLSFELSPIGKDIVEADLRPEHREVLQQARSEWEKNAGAWEALGYPKFNAQRISDYQDISGLEFRDEEGLVVDPVALYKDLNRSGDVVDTSIRQKLMEVRMDEELIHAAQRKAAGPEWMKKHRDIWNDPKLDPELKRRVEKEYPQVKGNEDLAGVEAVRMVIQGRWKGTITEAIYRAVQDFIRYIRGLDIQTSGSKIFRDTVANAEKALQDALKQNASGEVTPAIQTPEGKVATGEDHVAAYEEAKKEKPEVRQRAIEEVSKVESLLGNEEETAPVSKRAAEMTQEEKLTRLNTELAEARKSGNTRAAKDIRARIKELGKVQTEATAEGESAPVQQETSASTETPYVTSQLWQKTREQAKTEGILAKHRFAVKDAIAQGEKVPLEVLEGFEGSKWADDARRKLYGKEISKSLLEKAEDFLKDDKGTLYADPLFIQTVGKPALRAAVKLIREGIEGGKLVRDAVEDAMTYLRSNVKGLDEDAAKKFFQPIIGDEPITDGPETNFKMPEREETPQEKETREVKERIAENLRKIKDQEAKEKASPPKTEAGAAGEPDTTAAYNAETDKLLEKNGFAPIAQEASKALGQSWSEALKLSQDFPEAGSKLVDELNKNPRALNDVDSGVLLKELADRKARQANAQDVVFRTSESGDESRNAEATAQLEKARNDVFKAITAAKAAGREWGRAGRFRQIHIDDDYSIIAMENKVRADVNKGEPLNKKQREQVEKDFKEIEKTKADFEKAQQAHLDADATAEADKIQQDIKKPARKSVLKVAKETVDRWKAEAEAEMGNLKNFFGSETGAVGDVNPKGGRKMGEERKSKIVSLAKVIRARVAEFGFDLAGTVKSLVDTFGEKVRPYIPDAWTEAKSMLAEKPPRTPQDILKEQKAGSPLDLKVVYELAQAHAREGVGSKMGVEGMNELMAAVHKDLKPLHEGLTEREVRDAFSGYGKVAHPSKEAVNVQLREARRLGQLASGIEDAENKQAPKKSGAQRDKPTQAIREQMNKLRDAMRVAGIEPSAEDQLASVNAARETALRNRIEDIRKEIETGKKRPKGTPVPDSDAVKALKAERDKAQAELDVINEAKNPKKSPEQVALDSAIKAVQKSISKYDEMLKTGDIVTKVAVPKFAPSDELETLQSERDVMKNAVDEMRKEALGKAVSKEERVRKTAIKALDKRIADLENRIRTGDVSKAPKRVSEADQFTDVRAKRAQVNALKEKLDALQKQQTARSETQMVNDRYQKVIAKRIAELEARTKAGDFSKLPAKQKAQLNQVSLKAKADFERAKEKFDLEVEKQRRENLPPSQKFWNHFVGLERAGKLTSVGVFGKLGIAALAREFTTTPIEEIMGTGISKILPGLASRAPRQGAGSLKAEIAAKRAFFTEGMRDAWQNLTFRKSDLEQAYGKKKYRELPPAWYEYMGFLHGAIKAPVKRAEFARSLQKRMEWAEKQGRNINDPNVMTELSQEAYLDGERAIFMQDNVVSKALTSAYRVAEVSDNRWASVLGRFFLPVVKVPTNIFGEAAESTYGTLTGAKKAVEAYNAKDASTAVKKGIEQLPPEQADVIMRQLKKGLIGPAMLALGYYGANSIGGFYQKDDKRTPSDVQPGNYRVGGVNLPRIFGHTVPAMLLNIGATMRRVAEEREVGQKKGLAVGTQRAAAGMVSELPFVPVVTSGVKALETEQGFDRFIQGLVTSSVVPGGVATVARLKDTLGSFPANTFDPPNARQPGKGVQGVVDAVKTGIPGARETVPLKKKRLTRR